MIAVCRCRRFPIPSSSLMAGLAVLVTLGAADLASATGTATPKLTATPMLTPTPTLTPTPMLTPTATLTPTPMLTPTATVTPITVINHLTCYEVKKLPFETVNVDVENPFGPTSIDVKKPKRLCNPTSKNGEDPIAPTEPEHFVGYRTRQTEPVRVELQRGLTVTNQFGTLLVDAKKPDIFMVPSAKNEPEFGPPPPLPTPLPVDHYECYRVRSAKATFPTVEIEDQFGTLTLDVKRPRSVCIATDLEGQGILEPEVHLACYKVKTAKRTPRFPGRDLIFVNNNFGNPQGLDFLRITRPTEICLPSTVTRCFTTPILGPCP